MRITKKIRAAYARGRKIRATIRELSNLSDRELSDIGIHRCNIRSVARENADLY